MQGATPSIITGPLVYHGGPVQDAPKVYVVFWGWTTDPSGEAYYLTNFLSSLGGHSWLSSVAEYGGGNPTTLFGGSWADSTSVPTQPTDAQIQNEALAAITHFGLGTSVNNHIIVATPTGHSTSGFGVDFCAYHSPISAYPSVSYTNLPYMTDAGTSCRQNAVNGGSSGLLDGVSIAAGHELAETITDPLVNVQSAWYDDRGFEIADKCADVVGNITTSAGTFAAQALWSNAANDCVMFSIPSSSQLMLTRYDLATTGMTTDTIRLSNPSTSTANVTVGVSGVAPQTVTVPPQGNTAVSFPNQLGGPVTVSYDVPVVAGQRVVYNNTFSEIYAVPIASASTQLLLSYYDQLTIQSNNIHIANPTGSQSLVSVSFGGNSQFVTVPANGAAIVSFPGLAGGPVYITSSDSPVIASSRTWFNSSFNDVNAIPIGQASTTLYFNHYDLKTNGISSDTIYISNPNFSAANVTVTFPGVGTQPVTIPAQGQATYSFAGKSGGPITISASLPVIASQRVRYKNSTSEVYAVPVTKASVKLMLNWYDLVGFSSDNIHIANPNGSSATVTVTVGTHTKTVTVGGQGAAVVNFPNVVGGPVFITANVGVLASARTYFNLSFNEVNAIPTL